ncbi:hypothetical protein [Pantoea sp. At-9b]|nr:hypothetical protein [Pantoea sp. At-9b]ADU71688.1 hypothetical protein Pat9b_5532 [Pantoea sp. At-9b]
MHHNHEIAVQAAAFVQSLKSHRHANMPAIRFRHWPQFISTVRELMEKN